MTLYTIHHYFYVYLFLGPRPPIHHPRPQYIVMYSIGMAWRCYREEHPQLEILIYRVRYLPIESVHGGELSRSVFTVTHVVIYSHSSGIESELTSAIHPAHSALISAPHSPQHSTPSIHFNIQYSTHLSTTPSTHFSTQASTHQHPTLSTQHSLSTQSSTAMLSHKAWSEGRNFLCRASLEHPANIRLKWKISAQHTFGRALFVCRIYGGPCGIEDRAVWHRGQGRVA